MRGLALFTSGTATLGATWTLPIRRWMQVAAERRALARLDERALADIGLDPNAASYEASRPFWDLPKRRRCGPQL